MKTPSPSGCSASAREPIRPRCEPACKRPYRADVRVLTLDEFIAKERDFWDHVAPIGTVFYIGVVMGFIVGCVICYQVLFADISDRLGEFATLKAMGYSNLRLFRRGDDAGRVPWSPGLSCRAGGERASFDWVHEATGLPLDLSRNNPLSILGLAVVMCVLSAAYAAQEAAFGRSRAALCLRWRLS